MKNSTIRLIVVLATLSITGITITQGYWVKRAFDLKEAEFNHSVSAALYNVAEQIFKINKTASPSVNPVKQASTNYFVVQMNSEIEPELLEHLIKTEFEKRNIKADFEYGVYDCSSECMIYGDYVPLQTGKEKKTPKTFPNWASKVYHFGVLFPNREAHLLNQMGIWSFSSVVLLVVIIFFSYTLFVILKQKRLSEIQKDFINNMTHEFKTPIATIAVSAEVLKDPDIIHQRERLLNYTTIIENENNRLKQHVERVLQMAKLDKEEIQLKKEVVNLNELIHEVVAGMSNTLQEYQGKIILHLSQQEIVIRADRHHLTNIFYNLLDNAIKYCDKTPEITIRTRKIDKGIELEILDNGIGISKDNQKRVFQKFYRVSTGNIHNVKGFGLGLHYVKQIIEAHRGKISLLSKEGEGCTFKIFFPFA